MSDLFNKWNTTKQAGLPSRKEMARRGARRVVLGEDNKQRGKGHAKKILALLTERRDWVATSELVEITHRFSASIHILRRNGHVIEERGRADGQHEWKFVETISAIKIKPSWQKAYYASPHWKQRRLLRLKHDDYTCCNCKCTEDLEVHHWRYDLFEERLGDLMTVCKTCHMRIHDAVRVVFPTHVSDEVYVKLDGFELTRKENSVETFT